MRLGTVLRRLAFPVQTAFGPPSGMLGVAPFAGGGAGGRTPEWADVVARYADVVYSTAFRLTGDDEEARDLAQDVLIRLHKGLHRYREGNFEGWLYRTTLNAFRDRIRKTKRRREDELPAEPLVRHGLAPGVEELAEQAELEVVVQRALVKLPGEYRAAVVLRDLEGRSYEEIAEILGVPAGTVRSRIHRGREALRQLLRPYMEAGS